MTLSSSPELNREVRRQRRKYYFSPEYFNNLDIEDYRPQKLSYFENEEKYGQEYKHEYGQEYTNRNREDIGDFIWNHNIMSPELHHSEEDTNAPMFEMEKDSDKGCFESEEGDDGDDCFIDIDDIGVKKLHNVVMVDETATWSGIKRYENEKNEEYWDKKREQELGNLKYYDD